MSLIQESSGKPTLALSVEQGTNWNALELHRTELFNIIDASIPNKAQNIALKRMVEGSVNILMNRIADGWLEFPVGNGTQPVPLPPQNS